MARKVNKKLAGAAAAAVAAVYATGYVWTQPVHQAAGADTPAAPVPSASASAAQPPAPGNTQTVDTPTTIARAIATAMAAPSATPSASAPPATTSSAAAYRDGTYSGTGTSRRGDVTVSLTVQNGQISDVKITRATTYYPVSDIARLPSEVVQRQSASVDLVSGATQSSLAFRGAVAQALAQARAASGVTVAPATGAAS